MNILFTYQDGILYMQNLCANGNKGMFQPEPNVYPELEIFFPGYKKYGDYRLELSNGQTPPCHTDICKLLFELVKNNTCTYKELFELLQDIYLNGTKVNVSKYSYSKVEKMVALIYWITLQDEINYPQQNGKMGARMPFCRYFEAIYCAQYNNVPLEEILRRCNNVGYRPTLYNISHVPIFYY